MATPMNPLSVNTSSNIDENAIPSSPKNARGPMSPVTPKADQNLTVDTGSSKPELVPTTAEDGSTDIQTKGSGYSTDNFSIDKFNPVDTLSIETCDSDRLERMMDKFDNLKASSEDGETTDASPAFGSDTPRALNQMMAKFDLLKSSSIDEPDQDRMMQNFDLLQKSTIRDDDYDDNNEAEKGAELKADFSESTHEMPEIEQFRSSDSHFEHDSTMSRPMSPPTSSDAPAGKSSQRLLEDRIVELMDQVSSLETKNDELQSQLRIQHDQDVQDMYQNPYSDPFASTSPTKAKGSFNSSTFLESATRNLNQEIIAPSPSMSSLQQSSNVDSSHLHRELTELRIHNQSLQNDLASAERVKEHLKKVLKTVELEDKQKSEQIMFLTNELTDSREREANLQSELDACKIRIEGFEIAQRHIREATAAERDEDEITDDVETNSKPMSTRSESIKSFFSGSDNKASMYPITQTGDVATALVVSQRQNEALQAHNEELEASNANLQKKCDELTEKYGLKEPAAGDDKGTQLYSRYLEMKSSLSSLSVVLEEVQEQNSMLNDRVEELETELNEQDGRLDAPVDSFDEFQSLTKTISAEQEETLKALVERLEIQILDYREAEERHAIVTAELESTVGKLEEEASTLRDELKECKAAPPSPGRQERESKLQKELDDCRKELESRVTKEKSDELRKELESLRDAMDAAADESTQLLNEMEQMLDSTREELRGERAKYKELEAKYKELLDNTVENDSVHNSDNDDDSVGTKEALSNSERLLNENERLNAAVLSLQEQTQQLKIELEKKTIKVEKSEQRVALKHEKANELKEANASLREGIQQLKGHLSTISEEASKTEELLATTKDELKDERKKVQQLEIKNGSLHAELDVLKEASSDGSTDEGSPKSIKVSASLAASQKELAMERELIEKISEEKRNLETLFDNTKSDLQIQLHAEKQKSLKLDGEISTLQEELEEKTRLCDVLENTKKLFASEKIRIQELTATKSSLELELDSLKNSIDDLSSSNVALKEEMEVMKSATKDTSEAAHQFSELEKLLATTQEELNEEEQRVESLEEQVDNLTLQIEELEKCKSDLQLSFDDVKQEMMTVKQKKSEFESLLQTTKADLAVQLQTMNSMRSASLRKEAEFNGAIGKKDAEIEALTAKLASTTAQEQSLATINNEKLEYKMKSEALSSEVDEKNKTIKELTAKLETLEEDMKNLEAHSLDLDEKTKEIEELTAKLESLEGISESAERVCIEKVGLAEKLRVMQSELDQKNTEISEMTSKLEKLESWENSKMVIEETMTEETRSDSAGSEKSTLLSKLENLEQDKKSLASSLKDAEANLAKMEALSKLLTEENTRFVSSVEERYNEENGDKASSDVRQWEVEMLLGKTKRDLEDALERNEMLTGHVKNLEGTVQNCQSTISQTLTESETHAYVSNERGGKIKALEMKITSLKEENDSFMKRAAALARRDQLQKASLETSNNEIAKLMATMSDFQERFETLAEQFEDGQLQKLKQMEAFEEKESKWTEERETLNERISSLETERDELNEHLTVLGSDSGTLSIPHCHTDRSIFNMRVGELEQELQLLQVTLGAKEQERAAATEELEELKTKLDACEEELSECRDEMESVVAQIETDLDNANERVTELEGEVESMEATIDITRKERDSAVAQKEEMASKLQALEVELQTCRCAIAEKEKRIEEIEQGNRAEGSSTLRAKNIELAGELEKCTKERDLLRSSAVVLKKEIDALKQENKIARVVASDTANGKEGIEQENLMMKELLATSQLSVAESKKMQQRLSKQVEVAAKRETRLAKEILALKAKNEDMEKRLEEQEKELDEFESDFALARSDARKVVEELRSQLLQLEKRNKQLEADNSVGKTEDLKNKLRQLISQNKRMQKEIEYAKVRERRLESQLGLEPARRK